MQHTTNYNLNQWDADDVVRREDFNADNAKIDAALAGGARVMFGTYTGSGSWIRGIYVGCAPKAVLVLPVDGQFCNSTETRGAFATVDCPAVSGENKILDISGNSFHAYQTRTGTANPACTNKADVPYIYLAFY